MSHVFKKDFAKSIMVFVTLVIFGQNLIASTDKSNESLRSIVNLYKNFQFGIKSMEENSRQYGLLLLKGCNRSNFNPNDKFTAKHCYELESRLTQIFFEKQVHNLSHHAQGLVRPGLIQDLWNSYEAYKLNKLKRNQFMEDKYNSVYATNVFYDWASTNDGTVGDRIKLLPALFSSIALSVPTALYHWKMVFSGEDYNNPTLRSMQLLIDTLHTIYSIILFPPSLSLRCPMDFGTVGLIKRDPKLVRDSLSNHNFTTKGDYLWYRVKEIEISPYGPQREITTNHKYIFEEPVLLKKSEYRLKASVFAGERFHNFHNVSEEACAPYNKKVLQKAAPLLVLMTPFRSLTREEYDQYLGFAEGASYELTIK